mmetsp:Transcript_14138/g.45276  ORF Transcript_14138/g.45276 Transcript_14138/m.45276 type:complete len:614 (+) Transcript_14138:31-1872(+)
MALFRGMPAFCPSLIFLLLALVGPSSALSPLAASRGVGGIAAARARPAVSVLDASVLAPGSTTTDTTAKGVVVPTAPFLKPCKTEEQPLSYVPPEPLQLQDGDALEAKWDKLRGTRKRDQLRRSMALQTFFLKACWKTVRANMTDDDMRTAMTAAWVRDGLLQLGPTMIKLGQVFSSRKDLLHPAYCEALESLQTAVPCVSASRVRELLEAELGSPLPFDSFDDTPLAGASLGQVHRAVYKGTPVAVKIQRAGLTEMFDTDFKNIRLGCRAMNLMERGYERIRRMQGKSKAAADRDWMAYANDAARLLYEEINYVNEGKNAEQFAESLVGTGSNVVVPKVFNDATTKKVLTMEYIESVKMTDTPKVDALGLDKKKLSQEVLDTFLLQLMQTGVLHCDPHPGNMCVTPSGRIVLYDFGMMDTLPQTTVQGMRKIAFGLLNGSPTPDAKEIATRGDSVMEGLEMSGFLQPGANATAVRMVGEFLVRFFSDQAAGRATQDVTEQIDYELRSLLDSGAIAFPSAFTFVARAFTSVDGIAKSLQPEIELRQALDPFVSQLITDEYTSQANAKRDELLAQAKGFFGQGGEGGGEGLPRDAALVAAGVLAGVAIAQILGL